jgi:hypothetical protein
LRERRLSLPSTPSNPASRGRDLREGGINAHGASPTDWDRFATTLGLAADLLPVVSNPHAEISPASNLAALGKTPSRYNSSRKVAGIAQWTSKASTPAEIAQWADEPDYGICIQTREVRALDVDVTDSVLAAEIASTVAGWLGNLPRRQRANSPKFLLAFRLPGNYTKRILRTAHGNVEMLAGGQQFVAAGTHPSGVRYEWAGGLPEYVPEIPSAKFEELWDWLATLYGTGGATTTRTSAGALVPRNAADGADDPLVDWLHANWEVHGEDARTGRVDIRCPFESGHSTETGATSTSYFPAGVGGYQRGHFRCLHASCAHRSDEDFIREIGYDAEMFDDLGDTPCEEQGAGGFVQAHAVDGIALPTTFTKDKHGRPLATIENLGVALIHPTYTGWRLGFDEFRAEISIAPAGTDEWRPFQDADYVKLRIKCEQNGFARISGEMMRDAVRFVVTRQKFDSAILWAESLPAWDGVKRIDRFVHTHFGAEDTAYTRAVGAYLWTALAGRVLVPGIKADMVPVLVGRQGVRKSTAVAALTVSPEHFREVNLSERDDDLSRRMRGCIVAELGELRGLHSRDLESIKAFLSRTHESWVPKYQEFAATFPRRLVFVGTSNPSEFLSDETGNRRFLPFQVDRCDPEAITRDRGQLWAEGIARFRAGGVEFTAAEELARAEHDSFRVTDEWESAVSVWLETPEMATAFCAEGTGKPKDRDWLTVGDVASGALGLQMKDVDRRREMRIGKVLKAMGYERRRTTLNGRQAWRWYRQAPR